MKYNVEKIKKYLIEHPNYFNDDSSVSSIDDVLFFKMRSPKNIIFIDEYFLCDIYGNEIWIVKLLKKKKHDFIRKKKLIIEAIVKVVDCYDENRKCRFYKFNGYWKIPDIN